MSEANIALMKRWFDEVWNQRRTATITELFAPNGVSHGAAEDGSDLRAPPRSFRYSSASLAPSPT